MSDNAQKTPLVDNLNRWWDNRGDSLTSLQGKALPAEVVSVDESNTIATIKFLILDDVVTFPQVTCSIATSKWSVAPIQPGDKGFVMSTQLFMGEVNGLGDGTATLAQMPNMSTMVFFPSGNSGFEALPEPGVNWIRGPNGVILQDEDGTAILEVVKDKGITINAAYGGNILKANLVEASDDSDAKGQGIPFSGLYRDPDGYVRFQRIPD